MPNGTIPNTTPAVGHKTAPPPIFGFGTLEGYGLRVALAGVFLVCLDVVLEVRLMAKLPQIIPVTDLRQDAAAVLKRVRDSREPLIITQRGRAAAVILSVEEYERENSERQILRLLARGEKEIAAGEGFDLDAVLAEADALLAEDQE